MFKFIQLFLVFFCVACQTKVEPVAIKPESLSSKPGELSVNDFASLPGLTQITWSPNGQYMAMIQNQGNKSVLVTQSRNGDNSHLLLQSDNKQSWIEHYQWLGNERLVVSVGFYEHHHDLKFTETRIAVIDREGKEIKADLIHFDKSDYISQFMDRFITLKDDDKHIVIALDKRVKGAPDVYKVDITSGETEMIMRNPGYVRSWIYDLQGRPRVGLGIKGTEFHIVHRMNRDEDWQEFARVSGSEEQLIPLGFGEDPNSLFFLAKHNGRLALFKANLYKPEQRELVFSDPKYDIRGQLIYDPQHTRAVGIYYQAQTNRQYIWDSEYKQRVEKVEKVLPAANFISSHDSDHLLLVSSSKKPATYYYYDEAKNSIIKLTDAYPNLKPELLANTEVVQVKAKDGVLLEGYLTKPVHASGNAGPAIVFPHGGPWARNGAEFDPLTQMMVNRGWTVLQLNFRGSAGYGDDFKQAGFKRWGLEMQDDITDGVRWLVDNKIADPGKVCIVGASYGGYAALMGMAKNPDLYRCAISIAPVTDLLDLASDWSDRRWLDSDMKSKFVEQRLGDSWSDSDRLKATSPINNTKQFRKPLLLIHGVHDRTVDVKHSRALVDQMNEGGFKDYRYIELQDSDHYFRNADDRLRLFQSIDEFLRTYY